MYCHHANTIIATFKTLGGIYFIHSACNGEIVYTHGMAGANICQSLCNIADTNNYNSFINKGVFASNMIPFTAIPSFSKLSPANREIRMCVCAFTFLCIDSQWTLQSMKTSVCLTHIENKTNSLSVHPWYLAIHLLALNTFQMLILFIPVRRTEISAEVGVLLISSHQLDEPMGFSGGLRQQSMILYFV